LATSLAKISRSVFNLLGSENICLKMNHGVVYP